MQAIVVMLGTDLSTMGGISAVVSIYRSCGLFFGAEVRYIPTHCDGGTARKLLAAIAGWLKYSWLLMRSKVALLHVHSASGPSFWRKFMFVAPALLVGKPVVLHWHGGGFVDFYQRSSQWKKRLIGWVFCRCSRVIALSDQWHDTLSAMFPTARVVTIPNPVLVPASVVALETASPRIVFLGRINPAKGIQELIQAMPEVLSSVPDCILVVAGSGEVERFSKLASRFEVSNSVQFPGWVDGRAKSALLASAAVFVLPSHLEAMPMSVLEAMACGLPVVATRVGGIPQAVRDGTDGLLVPPRDAPALADALVRVLTDVDLRCTLGRNARRRVQEQFAAELIVPRVQALWQTVLQEHSQARTL